MTYLSNVWLLIIIIEIKSIDFVSEVRKSKNMEKKVYLEIIITSEKLLLKVESGNSI